MSNRPDLDLSSILEEYDEYLTSVDQWGSSMYGDEPVLVGGHTSPGCFSTSRQVGPPRAPFAWDTNGWYRSIGIPFPYTDASVAALSRSYIATGGQANARATYCLKRLLHRQTRDDYDRQPLGTLFMDDEMVQARIRELARQEMLRRRMAGEEGVTPERVMSEMGYDFLPEESDTASPFDTASTGRQDRRSQRLQDKAPWGYGYWMWRRTRWVGRVVESDIERRMADWQILLVAEAAARGMTLTIGVGVVGGSASTLAVRPNGDHPVVFLPQDAEPNASTAAEAVTLLSKYAT